VNDGSVVGSKPWDVLWKALEQRGACNLIAREVVDLLPLQALQQDQQEHEAYFVAKGIRMEQRPMPFQGIPYVITQRTFTRIADSFRQLFGVLEQVIDLYLAEPAVREYFRLAPRHDRLVQMGAHYRPRIQCGRYDFTLDSQARPRIYELNTHCPAAMTFCYHFGQTFSKRRLFAHLREQGLRPAQTPVERPGTFARAVLASAENAGALQRGRNVAILNSRYLTMNNELDLIAEQFREQGCETIRCFVEDLRFDGQQLWYGQLPLHLVYNKYDDSHGPDAYECAFSRTTAEVQAYLDAYRAGSVFSVNTFPSMYLTEQKSTLAFLWSPLLQQRLGRHERALIEEIVPRTRMLRHLPPDELAEAAAHPERYVLKRSLDTRGRSVLIGRSTPAEEWHRTLALGRDALPGDDYVLQELAASEESAVAPSLGLEAERMFTSLACFLFSGEPAGLMIRTSAEETTNVARRGFVQPALMVEEP
jgi:uncharacterized circularly permuted ATP-grasp superfamily protein